MPDQLHSDGKPSIRQYKCQNCGYSTLGHNGSVCPSCTQEIIDKLMESFESLAEVVGNSHSEIEVEEHKPNIIRPKVQRMETGDRFEYSPKHDIAELKSEIDKILDGHSAKHCKSLYGDIRYFNTQLERTIDDHPLTLHHLHEG